MNSKERKAKKILELIQEFLISLDDPVRDTFIEYVYDQDQFIEAIIDFRKRSLDIALGNIVLPPEVIECQEDLSIALNFIADLYSILGALDFKIIQMREEQTNYLKNKLKSEMEKLHSKIKHIQKLIDNMDDPQWWIIY
ncbi:MAG: hypothetical protein ACTSW1_06745 [Candidatus Hodarchaeales archaeon]